jgi:hypothetical protein
MRTMLTTTFELLSTNVGRMKSSTSVIAKQADNIVQILSVIFNRVCNDGALQELLDVLDKQGMHHPPLVMHLRLLRLFSGIAPSFPKNKVLQSKGTLAHFLPQIYVLHSVAFGPGL